MTHHLEAPLLDEFVPTADRMPAIVMRFTADRDALWRKLALPYSPAARKRMGEFVASWLDMLEGIPFDELTRSDRVDWHLLQSLLRAEMRRLDRIGRLVTEAEDLLPFFETLIGLEEERRSLVKIDHSEAAGRLDQAISGITSVQQELKSGARTVSPSIAGYAAEVTGHVRKMLGGWFHFYHRYDPLFTWWVEKPYRKLDEALVEYAAFLRNDVAAATGHGIIGNPIGRDELVSELNSAQVRYTPEELIAAARQEMSWCRRQMRDVAGELGYGDDWAAALEYVKSCHAAPGEQPYLVQALALEAVDYVDAHDLITVPPLARECWRMEMMSLERQKINPFFLGGESIVLSFPTNEMDHDQKRMSLRGNNRSFARATVHHELIPGHHLQGFFQERHRPYRRIFYTPFWVEGWTLHWEMLLWERGFAQSPEDKMGMLFWRKHRCARVIFSLSFHLGQMTPQECIDMLVNEVGHERDNAEAEVRRSFDAEYNPLYQCAYLIGGMQMHALYHEIVGSKRMTPREFHDAVMRENSMPIPTLRAVLTDQPINRDFMPDWRFWRQSK